MNFYKTFMNWVARRTVVVKLLSNLFQVAFYLLFGDGLLAECNREL